MKRKQQTHTQEPPKKSVVVVVGDEDGLEELWSAHATSAQSPSINSLTLQRSSSFAETLLAGLEDTSNSISPLRSLSLTIDLGFSTAFVSTAVPHLVSVIFLGQADQRHHHH